MALIQAYGREETELDRFSGENKGSLEAQLRALRLQNTYVRLTDLLVTLSTAGVLYFGGRAALGGDILPGTLVVFVAYLRDIYGSVEKFGELFLSLAKSASPLSVCWNWSKMTWSCRMSRMLYRHHPSGAGSNSKTSALHTKRARRF